MALQSGVVEWDGLRVETDPWRAYWQGKRIPLERRMVQILYPLVESGQARFNVLWSFLKNSAKPETVYAYITHIRGRFAKAGVPVKIVNDYGWGWRLELEGACN
jgi:hypothetical protein